MKGHRDGGRGSRCVKLGETERGSTSLSKKKKDRDVAAGR